MYSHLCMYTLQMGGICRDTGMLSGVYLNFALGWLRPSGTPYLWPILDKMVNSLTVLQILTDCLVIYTLAIWNPLFEGHFRFYGEFLDCFIDMNRLLGYIYIYIFWHMREIFSCKFVVGPCLSFCPCWLMPVFSIGLWKP